MTTTSQASGLKAKAIEYAERGWAVFSLTPRSKEPLKGTHGQDDATTDLAGIERMWRDALYANVGISCAPSGLYVVDVDMDEVKGKQGRATWTALMAEHGHVDTYTVRTWTGGLHFYYQMPEGLALTNTAGTGGSTGRGLGVDIDTRGNGFVVAAGSVISDSDGRIGTYTVEHDLPVAPLPQWIIDAVTAKPRPGLTVSGPAATDDAVYARVLSLAGELRDAPDGEGNDTANRTAYKVGQYVGAKQIDGQEATRLMLDAISGWTWRTDRDFSSMASTIERAIEDGARRPRAWEAPINPGAAPAAPLSVQEGTAVVPDPFTVEEEDLDPVEESERAISMWATDNGQGVFLRDRIGDMLYAVGVGWMVWDSKRWKRVAPEVIQNKVSRFYRQQFEKMLKQYMSTMDTKYNDLAKAYKGFMSSARLGSIMNHLKVTDGVLVDAADLDTHKDLLNTPNGVVNLRTGHESNHERTLLFTKITRGSYRPGQRHPDWEMALTALPGEAAEYMQVRMGQAVTGYIPESDDAIFLVGHGSNGKSLWTSDGVFRAIGDYGNLAQATLISKVTEGSGPTPERFGLRGCRFVLIEELPEGRALSIAEVKRITGMSVITARDLHEKQVTFDATHTLFITTNYLPPVAEVDEGSWRRFCCIRFPFRFRAKPETETDRQGDPGLKARLREGEGGQHDAIVTWLVDGARKYFADRAIIMDDRRPDSVREATMDWRKEADRVLAFIDERLEFPDSEAEVSNIARADLYAEFCKFLDERGHAKWSQETFLQRFRSHEVIRSHQVAEAQTRNHDTLSRPPLAPNVVFNSTTAALPKVVRVFKGVTFKVDE